MHVTHVETWAGRQGWSVQRSCRAYLFSENPTHLPYYHLLRSLSGNCKCEGALWGWEGERRGREKNRHYTCTRSHKQFCSLTHLGRSPWLAHSWGGLPARRYTSLTSGPTNVHKRPYHWKRKKQRERRSPYLTVKIQLSPVQVSHLQGHEWMEKVH